MRTNKKISLPYIAGFFDGEGCIVVKEYMKYNPVMKKRYLCKTIRMEVCNTDHDIINDIHNFFKLGKIYTLKKRKESYKEQIRWQLTHRQAEKVIRKILPYMREKNKINQALKVLEFYNK